MCIRDRLTAIQNLVYIEKSGLILATLVDVTREEEQAAKDYEKRLETIDLAQKVIYCLLYTSSKGDPPGV